MSYDNTELARAFPVALRDDVLRVASTLSQPRHSTATFAIDVTSETLAVPYRIYHDPPLVVPFRFTTRQEQIIHCLFTRHRDGFVREEHLRRIISVPEDWVAPFVVQLVGEYVMEILGVVRQYLDLLDRDVYRRFLTCNPRFYARTRQRIISYWDCYYRSERKSDYPGFQIMAFFDRITEV